MLSTECFTVQHMYSLEEHYYEKTSKMTAELHSFQAVFVLLGIRVNCFPLTPNISLATFSGTLQASKRLIICQQPGFLLSLLTVSSRSDLLQEHKFRCSFYRAQVKHSF